MADNSIASVSSVSHTGGQGNIAVLQNVKVRFMITKAIRPG